MFKKRKKETIIFLSGLALLAVGLVLLAEGRGILDSERPAKTIAQKLGVGPDGEMSYGSLKKISSSKNLDEVVIYSSGKSVFSFEDSSRAWIVLPESERVRLAKEIAPSVPVYFRAASDPLGIADIIRIILPLALIVLLVVFIASRMQGTRELPKKTKDTPPKKELLTTFDDVAGVDEAREEMEEFITFLHNPEKFHKLGARIPSGAILYGPPGTGKTLLAKALAGSAGVPFFYLAASEAINKYVGVGAGNIRNIFQKARRAESGAVIFIDEIDAIGKARGGGDESGASREHDQTLNQLLVELDGFQPSDKVIVIAATNRIDTLDPALIRPGRLSRNIPVLPPTEEGRLAILRLYTKNKPLDSEVDLKDFARSTAGSTGADLAEMVNEAAIFAARSGRETIATSDLKEGYLRALLGPERKSSSTSEEELRAISYHEAGHVICAEMCSLHENTLSVSIVARGQSAGAALYGREDKALHSLEYVKQQLICVLGGRAAERIAVGEVSSGAANDLQQANELARRAIEDWGLSELTGQLLSRGGHHVSDKTRELVDREVESMVAECFREAVELLEENRAALDNLAETLLREKTLERVDILSAIEGKTRKRAPQKIQHPALEPAMGAPPKKKGRRPRQQMAKTFWSISKERLRKREKAK